MYRLFLAVFKDFNTELPVINTNASTANPRIIISYCIFENLTVSNLGKAGAICLSNFDFLVHYNKFIKCACLNKNDNQAGNSINSYTCFVEINNCLIDKCVEGEIPSADSPIYARDLKSLLIQNTNFTNCVAQYGQTAFGASSIECIGTKTGLLKYCQIEKTKAYKAVYIQFEKGNTFNGGDIKYVNIIDFDGVNFLEFIENAICCCFFNLKIRAIGNLAIKFENCFTDNEILKIKITDKTEILLTSNAHWRKLHLCTKVNKRTSIVCAFFYFYSALNLVNFQF